MHLLIRFELLVFRCSHARPYHYHTGQAAEPVRNFHNSKPDLNLTLRVSSERFETPAVCASVFS